MVFIRQHTDVHVLLVEDNPADAEVVRVALADDPASDWALRHESTLESAVRYTQNETVDVILLDLGLGRTDGIATLQSALGEFSPTPIIILSALDSIPLAEEAVELGAQDFLLKDEFNAERLRRCLRYALKRPTATLNPEAAGEVVDDNPTPNAANGEIALLGSLHRVSYSDFESCVALFEELVEHSITQRSFRVKDESTSSKLDNLSARLSQINAAAVDLVDIQRIAINNMAIGKNRKRQSVQIDEARLLLIGLLARVADHYRSQLSRGGLT